LFDTYVYIIQAAASTVKSENDKNIIYTAELFLQIRFVNSHFADSRKCSAKEVKLLPLCQPKTDYHANPHVGKNQRKTLSTPSLNGK